MSIRWTLLSSLGNNARSSHCAAVTSTGHLLLYSGELRPRIPVDNSIHVFDLEAASSPATPQAVDVEKNNNSWRVLNHLSSLTQDQVPQPRVGATAAYDSKTESLYVWGGRGGVDPAPIGRDQAGVWSAKLNGLPSSDVITWEQRQATNQDSDEVPASRSYHASVIAGGKLYIHAGCPAAGRLGALHAFDLTTNTWHKCTDAPAEPRGGTAIAPVVLPSNQSEQVLIRFGGFAGHQLPKVNQGSRLPLDIYFPSTNAWITVYPTADPENGFPGPRSVHGLVPFTSGSPTGTGTSNSNSVPVALLYFGERDASSLGHAGAGAFWDDAWLLLASPSKVEAFQWKKLNVSGTQKPEGRGWFSPASYVTDGGKTRVVLTGGLLSSNERSGEVWVGDVEL